MISDHLLSLSRCGLLAMALLTGCKSTHLTSRLDAQQRAINPSPVGSQIPPTPSAVAPVAALSPASAMEHSTSLFDGSTLKGWKITGFAGAAEVRVDQDFKGQGPAILLEQGVMTGITWTNSFPTNFYELSLDAMRVQGGDFFCGLTFPVGPDPCSLIVGGWGGSVVGLSSVDGEDAAHNETTKYMKFDEGKWYRIRLRVDGQLIQAWIDGERVVNLDPTDHRLSIRIEVEPSRPLGIATWSTTGAFRNLKVISLRP